MQVQSRRLSRNSEDREHSDTNPQSNEFKKNLESLHGYTNWFQRFEDLSSCKFIVKCVKEIRTKKLNRRRSKQNDQILREIIFGELKTEKVPI